MWWGSIPLEAQRLGLEAHGSDLNPVAVLITKAMIEIPPRFAGQPPINPDAQNTLGQSKTWKGATGLAEDVRYYGKWMRKEAEKRIGPLYPKVKLPKEQRGGEATVIAWIWARRAECHNPICKAKMPLPTYSPHLNLIERLWHLMRDQINRSYFFQDLRNFDHSTLSERMNWQKTHTVP